MEVLSEKAPINSLTIRVLYNRMIKVKMEFFIIGKYSIFGK